MGADWKDMNPGAEFIHKELGRVMLIGVHPHDGACFVVEGMSTIDPDDDDQAFYTCERHDLTPVEGSEWPYLGFTKRTVP